MGFDPMSIPYLRICHDRGLGVADPRGIDLVGDDLSKMNLGFRVSRSLVIWGDQMLRKGPLRFLERLALHSPLVVWAPMASNIYPRLPLVPDHRPRAGSPRFRRTAWGRFLSTTATAGLRGAGSRFLPRPALSAHDWIEPPGPGTVRIGIVLGPPRSGRCRLWRPRTGTRRAAPTFLLITVDTLRDPIILGCYGYDRRTSPVIDRLAAGRRAVPDRHHPPPAAPSSRFPSILTGVYPMVHGPALRGPELGGARGTRDTDRIPEGLPVTPRSPSPRD